MPTLHDNYTTNDNTENDTYKLEDALSSEIEEDDDSFDLLLNSIHKKRKSSILFHTLILFLTTCIIVTGLGIYVYYADLEDDMLSLVSTIFPTFYTTASSTISDADETETTDTVIDVIEDLATVPEEIEEELPLYPNIPAPAPLDYSLEEALVVLEEYATIDGRFSDILLNQENYPEEILICLSNNPEMLTFVSDYHDIVPTFHNDASAVLLTDEEMASSCPLFLQWDERWGYATYGDNYLFASGCGPTALSMVVQGLTGDDSISPLTIATFAMENDYYMFGTGTKWNLMLEGATHFGLTSYCLKNNEALMKERLDRGDYLICSVGAGDFTAAGHFIVIYDYDETGFMVNDPFCYARSQETWPFEKISPQIKSIWTLGTP